MAQLMPLHPKTLPTPASFKSTLVLPFWYRLTQAVLEKRQLIGVVVVLKKSGRQTRNSSPEFALHQTTVAKRTRYRIKTLLTAMRINSQLENTSV